MINGTTPVNTSAAMPVAGPFTTKPVAVKNTETQLAKGDAPSSDVQISAAAKIPQVTGLTSVQFDVDPSSGKTVVSVISKDDNSVIRQIPTPVSLAKGISATPAEHPTINTAV
jgi:hypothetical protein